MSKDDIMDDIMEYIGYEYVTSHMDKRRKPRMIIKPHRNLPDDGLDLNFLDCLLNISTELYLHIDIWDYKEKQEAIHKIMDQLRLVKSDYNITFPNRDKITAHVFLELEKEINLYFLESTSEDESFQIMKNNYLSDGKYYIKNDQRDCSGGIIRIIQLTPTLSMCVLLIDF